MRSQHDSWASIRKSKRRKDGQAFVRVVSLDNLRAMCQRLTSAEHSFSVKQVFHTYIDVIGRHGDATVTVSFRIERSKRLNDHDNPNVFLSVLRIGSGLQSEVRAIFEPLVTSPTLWRDPITERWLSHAEIRAVGQAVTSVIPLKDSCTYCDLPGGNQGPPSDRDSDSYAAGKYKLPEQDRNSPIRAASLQEMRNRGGDWYAYRNLDLSSHTLGNIQAIKCGEGCTFSEPPKVCPNTKTALGFRYTYQGRINLATGLIEPYMPQWRYQECLESGLVKQEEEAEFLRISQLAIELKQAGVLPAFPRQRKQF